MLGIPFLNLLFIYLCNETKKLHQYEMLKIRGYRQHRHLQ